MYPVISTHAQRVQVTIHGALFACRRTRLIGWWRRSSYTVSDLFISMTDQFYVYVHTRNDTGETFYVGKGKGQRAFRNASSGRSVHWHRVVKKHGHTVLIVERFESEADAHSLERYLIASYAAIGHRLVNSTDGGEGTSGYVYSAESKEKMRLAKLGKKMSDEARANMCKAQANKTLSAEHRAKISASHVGIKHGPEAKAKMSIAKKGTVHTAEHIAKNRAAQTGRVCSEETIEKQRIVQTGKKRSEATKEKVKASWVLRKARHPETNGVRYA